MKTIRHTPRAINEPLLFLGIDRIFLSVLIVLCALIALRVSRLLAIALFAGGYVAGQAIARRDPRALFVFQELWKFKPRYDPVNRKPFKLELL